MELDHKNEMELLDLEIKYKDNYEILNLINLYKDLNERIDATETSSTNLEEINAEIDDCITTALGKIDDISDDYKGTLSDGTTLRDIYDTFASVHKLLSQGKDLVVKLSGQIGGK